MTDNPKPWEDNAVLLPRFNALMKLKKADLVDKAMNPAPGIRGLMPRTTYAKWKKEELAWSIASSQEWYAHQNGRTGI